MSYFFKIPTVYLYLGNSPTKNSLDNDFVFEVEKTENELQRLLQNSVDLWVNTDCLACSPFRNTFGFNIQDHCQHSFEAWHCFNELLFYQLRFLLKLENIKLLKTGDRTLRLIRKVKFVRPSANYRIKRFLAWPGMMFVHMFILVHEFCIFVISV